MDAIHHLIGRDQELFSEDVRNHEQRLSFEVQNSSFLVVGGAGAIGRAVVKELFKRGPGVLHVVDISENNLVELVRDVRSSLGYISGDFRTFALDCGSRAFDLLFEEQGPYDFVLNLSALKHVRSEKDPYTLMRMIEVNVLNTEKLLNQAQSRKARKYFCVSTDKATNPVNMMGASKRIMEIFLFTGRREIPVSTSRFANVAFSDGSLLHGFTRRLQKRQPLTAPLDIRRYFLTPGEAGQLCLLSCILGRDRDILFPKLSEALHLTTFADIARRYLYSLGYEPFECRSEQEARDRAGELPAKGQWACYFHRTETTGEKDFEEFYTPEQELDLQRFSSIGVIKNPFQPRREKRDLFFREITRIRDRGRWDREELIALFQSVLPEFRHLETGKYLDDRM
ncbi:MAG: UDP-N-acetylglucosamine 4,6-dehydratase [Desulfohalobiaceae bacterium]|nr:UDP-N-acetylglucosamine 4,6-dehydratase [Desulfohalobiaceae bacterium]